jgi:putative transposase
MAFLPVGNQASSVAHRAFRIATASGARSDRLFPCELQPRADHGIRIERQRISWLSLRTPTRHPHDPAMHYRRSNAEGSTYFFTVNLADRSGHLLAEKVDDLRFAVRTVKERHPFEIVAWVVLPDHLHAVWALPPGDADFPMRWALIKAGFSRRIERTETIGASRLRKGERGIWQRRFWEHRIRDESDLARHVDYVHINPVKHGHAARASDWPYSSIHRYIRNGDMAIDWAAPPGSMVATGGE